MTRLCRFLKVPQQPHDVAATSAEQVVEAQVLTVERVIRGDLAGARLIRRSAGNRHVLSRLRTEAEAVGHQTLDSIPSS
jgi:hypothetical protein